MWRLLQCAVIGVVHILMLHMVTLMMVWYSGDNQRAQKRFQQGTRQIPNASRGSRRDHRCRHTKIANVTGTERGFINIVEEIDDCIFNDGKYKQMTFAEAYEHDKSDKFSYRWYCSTEGGHVVPFAKPATLLYGAYAHLKEYATEEFLFDDRQDQAGAEQAWQEAHLTPRSRSHSRSTCSKCGEQW